MYPNRNYKDPAVYILASRRNGTIYTGVTSKLFSRIAVHQQDIWDGFTKRYGVHRLVYFEHLNQMDEAIAREKQIKKWGRARKIAFIEKSNPAWKDLYPINFGA
jgi:putative endonuclease